MNTRALLPRGPRPSRSQPVQGVAIETDYPPTEPRPPLTFELPYPLAPGLEVAIVTTGDEGWGGGRVFCSEDDDRYEYVGELNQGLTMGWLVDALPPAAAIAAYAAATVRIELVGERKLPATSIEHAVRRRTALYLADPAGEQIIAPTMTRFLESTDETTLYELSGPIGRGAYGTGRGADDSFRGVPGGTPLVLLTREIFRMRLEPRHIGRPLWFKVCSYNDTADPDSTVDPVDVEPVVHIVSGRAIARDPRRWL